MHDFENKSVLELKENHLASLKKPGVKLAYQLAFTYAYTKIQNTDLVMTNSVLKSESNLYSAACDAEQFKAGMDYIKK